MQVSQDYFYYTKKLIVYPLYLRCMNCSTLRFHDDDGIRTKRRAGVKRFQHFAFPVMGAVVIFITITRYSENMQFSICLGDYRNKDFTIFFFWITIPVQIGIQIYP